MKKEKKYTFKEFKEFLGEECYDLQKYKEGKYDRKIWNWFDVGKPIKVQFYKKGKRMSLKDNKLK